MSHFDRETIELGAGVAVTRYSTDLETRFAFDDTREGVSIDVDEITGRALAESLASWFAGELVGPRGWVRAASLDLRAPE